MAYVDFTGHDVVVWFQENPANEQEWQYRVRYECGSSEVIHYVVHDQHQSTNADGMRVYKDVLSFEENRAAGLTRAPKIYLATQLAGQDDWSTELLIDALNPAPDVPPMTPLNGYDLVQFTFEKPDDTDWAGFVVWADTQTPVRKDYITSKYEGPNNVVQLSLAEDTQYYITYAAYDAFGTDLLNEATIELHTLPKASILLPVLNEHLEAVEAIQFQQSNAFINVAKAYGEKGERDLLKAEERIGVRIDDVTGDLVAYFTRELGAAKDGLYASIEQEQEARVSEDEALASSLETLNATVETNKGDFQAALQTEQTARATKDNALASDITRLGATLRTETGAALDAAIYSERTARVSADNAITLRLDQQASKIADNEANFGDQIQTLVDADSSLSERITGQSALWNSDISGAIIAATQTITQAYADADGALAEQIEQMSTQYNGLSVDMEAISKAQIDGDTALGQRIDAISVTDYSGEIATIQQNMSVQTDRVNGLSAQYTLRIDNAGKISGFGLASDANGNSEFAVVADRFVLAAPGVTDIPFEFVSGQLRVKQAMIGHVVIDGAQINDLSVNTLKIAGGAVTANQVVTGGDTYVAAGGSSYFLTTGFMTIGDGTYGSGIIDVSFTIDATTGYDSSCLLELYVDTGSGFQLNRQIVHGITTDDGDTVSRIYGALKTVVSGSQVRVQCRCTSGTYTPRSVARIIYVRDITMTLMGAKR
jgi:hypothetical protein